MWILNPKIDFEVPLLIESKHKESTAHVIQIFRIYKMTGVFPWVHTDMKNTTTPALLVT